MADSEYFADGTRRPDGGILRACSHQWQPIETAPKDGTEFLGLNAHDREYGYVITRWGEKQSLTHWMPLPPLPVEEETDG